METIYLDYAATTQPSSDVLDVFVKASTSFYGNEMIDHELGTTTAKILHQSKERIAAVTGFSHDEIFVTSGGTEANNLALIGIARAYQQRGKHIITSQIEHASVYETCQYLETEGFEVTYLQPNHTGHITCSMVEEALREDTILVSLMHVNNELGTITDIEQIGKLLKAQKQTIYFHVDAVQAFGKLQCNYGTLHVDALSLSMHKIHGIRGTGFLFLRKHVNIVPLFHGGTQEHCIRPGTVSVAGVVAGAKAIVNRFEKMKEDYTYVEKCSNMLQSRLMQNPKIHINTQAPALPHIMNISIEGYRGEMLLRFLSSKGIYVSTQSACSSRRQTGSRVIFALGVSQEHVEGTLRLSMSSETTYEELEYVCAILESI